MLLKNYIGLQVMAKPCILHRASFLQIRCFRYESLFKNVALIQKQQKHSCQPIVQLKIKSTDSIEEKECILKKELIDKLRVARFQIQPWPET